MRRIFLTVGAALLFPLAAIAAQSAAVQEGNAGNKIINVIFSVPGPQNQPISGDYTTVDGTATVGDNDYIPVSGTFFIDVGQTQSLPVPIRIVGDTKVESDEVFSLVITKLQNGAAVDPGPYTFTIINDDFPAVTVADASVTEGNSGTTSLPFVVTLTTPSQIPVDVTYQTTNGTATSGTDYVPAAGTVTFAPGETQKTIIVTVNGDTSVEPNETLTLTVTPAGGTAASATGTIVNDDIPVVTVANQSVTEGNSGTTPLTFTITMPSAAAVPVEVSYQTADGTATAGSDYQAANGKLSFAPGETQKTVVVSVIGDTNFEPDETFTLTVTPTGGAAVNATGTIINDDARPVSQLRIVSGNNQSGRLGVPFAQPLVVQALNSDNVGVPGLTIVWAVTKGTATLSGATSVTDAQGRTSITATPEIVGAIEVRASITGVGAVTFTLASNTDLEARAKGPVAVPIAHVLDQICARNDQTFSAVCRALSTTSDDQLTPALERVAPQQSGAQAKVATQIVADVTEGIRSRLALIRGGGAGRFSAQNITFNRNGRAIPISMISAALGGGAGDSDYNGWSAFVSGNFGDGERLPHFGATGFDLTSKGGMIGVDRQFGDSVFGASLNLMNLDAKLNDNAGSLDTDAYAVSLYGSRSGLFANNTPGAHYDGLHLDGSLTFGRNRYDAEHVVDIAPLPISRARSKNNADMYAVSAGTGFEAHHGRMDVDFSLSGTWSRTRIASLTEDGTGPLVLFVQGHDVKSTTGNLGLNLRWAFPTGFGEILPSLRGELLHEFEDSARLVTAHFLRDNLSTSFTVPVDRPDANYGKVSGGLQAVFPFGWSAFVEVTQDVARTDLHWRTVQVNVSKSF